MTIVHVLWSQTYAWCHICMVSHTLSLAHTLICMQFFIARSLHRINSLFPSHHTTHCCSVCTCEGMHTGHMNSPCLYEHGRFITAWLTYITDNLFLLLNWLISDNFKTGLSKFPVGQLLAGKAQNSNVINRKNQSNLSEKSKIIYIHNGKSWKLHCLLGN